MDGDEIAIGFGTKAERLHLLSVQKEWDVVVPVMMHIHRFPANRAG